MPPVDPGTAWTLNSNSRFFVQDPKKGNVTWDATTRTMTMTGGGRVTLGASDKPYSFCKLNMSGNSQLIVAQGAVVTIIFHSPETCGQTGDPVTQVNMTGNTQFVTTSGNPYDLRIVMAGSESIPTKAHFTGNSGSEMTIYAPQDRRRAVGEHHVFRGGRRQDAHSRRERKVPQRRSRRPVAASDQHRLPPGPVRRMHGGRDAHRASVPTRTTTADSPPSAFWAAWGHAILQACRTQPPASATFRARVLVRHAQPVVAGTRVGCEFIDLTTADVERVVDTVFALQREKARIKLSR